MGTRTASIVALVLALLIHVSCGSPPPPQTTWVQPDDQKLEWLNVAEWEPTDGADRPVRVPKQWRDQFPEQTANQALAPADVVLRIATNAQKISMRISVPPPDRPEGGQQQGQGQQGNPQGSPPRPQIPRATAFDVYKNGQYLRTVEPSSAPGVQEVAVYDDPSGASVELAVLFPYSGSFLVHGVGITGGSAYGPPPHKGPRVLFHGDSITQGVGTAQARGNYVWVTCEQLRCEPINLGFAGSAWGDKPVAEYIASRNDFNAVVLAFGTNSYRRASETPAQFSTTYETFVSTIRKTHPQTPILCITPLWRAADTTGEKNQTGYTHQQYRDAVSRAVKKLQASDPNLYLLDGKELVPQELYAADEIHPTDDGAAIMAAAVAEALKPHLPGMQ